MFHVEHSIADFEGKILGANAKYNLLDADIIG